VDRSTCWSSGLDPDTAIAELGKTVPLGRIAEPEDIAEVVLFLASDAARYMCGALVEVNGGKPVA
jgi:2-keto-3-deoxy-L-fuconate dehydrogenase